MIRRWFKGGKLWLNAWRWLPHSCTDGILCALCACVCEFRARFGITVDHLRPLWSSVEVFLSPSFCLRPSRTGKENQCALDIHRWPSILVVVFLSEQILVFFKILLFLLGFRLQATSLCTIKIQPNWVWQLQLRHQVLSQHKSIVFRSHSHVDL